MFLSRRYQQLAVQLFFGGQLGHLCICADAGARRWPCYWQRRRQRQPKIPRQQAVRTRAAGVCSQPRSAACLLRIHARKPCVSRQNTRFYALQSHDAGSASSAGLSTLPCTPRSVLPGWFLTGADVGRRSPPLRGTQRQQRAPLPQTCLTGSQNSRTMTRRRRPSTPCGGRSPPLPTATRCAA